MDDTGDLTGRQGCDGCWWRLEEEDEDEEEGVGCVGSREIGWFLSAPGMMGVDEEEEEEDDDGLPRLNGGVTWVGMMVWVWVGMMV